MIAALEKAEGRHAAEIIRAFDLARLSPAFLEDPYPTYRILREHAPVRRLPDGSFFLTRYDDLVTVYHDTSKWSSDKRVDFRPNFGDSLLYEHHTTSLVFNDPPVHTRVRKLLAPVFHAARAQGARASDRGSRRSAAGQCRAARHARHYR